MAKVVIYQLPDENPMKFRGTSSSLTVKSFDVSAYNTVYECVRSDDYTNEDAFEEFNINHPSDFRSHSLSVSDMVSIDGKKYFCDSVGWIEVVDGKISKS